MDLRAAGGGGSSEAAGGAALTLKERLAKLEGGKGWQGLAAAHRRDDE